MVESDSDTEKVEITGHNFSRRGSQGSGLPRDPSFSGWCDEDEASPTDDLLENVDQSVEDFHFELPLLQQGELEKGPLDLEIGRYRDFQQKSMRMNGGTITDRFPGHDMRNGNGNGNGKYVAFDIEDGPESDHSFSNVGDNGFNMDNTGSSQSNRRSSIAAADILKTLILILVWYTFSTLLTLYNKTLLGDDLGKFPAPLLMNATHFTIQAVLSKAITWCWSQRFQPSVPMTWRDYFLRVVPTALGTAMDINLSNASLVFISVTFATMCKSAAPIFLLLFAFAFRLESPSFKLSGIIVVISIGVLLTVAKETEFEFWGFIFVMLAAVMSGFRWCMTQILLQKEIYGLKNPLTLMSYVTPVMAVATALLSLLLDPWDEFRKSSYFNSSWHITQSCLLMLFGGTLAFFMVLTEYVLVSVTSAVTVTIAGVVKEAVTILVAVFYFHDQFTWLKGVGLIIIMVGVSLFNWYKYQKLQKGELGEKNLETTNAAAKYVILEELDDQEDSS